MAVLRPKKAWPSLATRQSRLQTDAPGRVAYARYGSAASANILCRALSSNSYEGWPLRSRRMMQPPGVTHHTLLGRAIRAKRTCLQTLAHPLFAQHQPLHGRVQVEGHAAAHTGPPVRRWPRTAPTASVPQPSHSCQNGCGCSSPLPHLCLDHQINGICRNAPVGHHAEDLGTSLCWTAPSRGTEAPSAPPFPAEAVRSTALFCVAMNRTLRDCSWSALIQLGI